MADPPRRNGDCGVGLRPYRVNPTKGNKGNPRRVLSRSDPASSLRRSRVTSTPTSLAARHGSASTYLLLVFCAAAVAPRLCTAGDLEPAAAAGDVAPSHYSPLDFDHLHESARYYHALIQRALAEAPGRALWDHPRSKHDGLAHASLSHENRRRGLQAAVMENVTLAPNRTRRKNPLDGLREYTGGWNPANKDYWASVAWSVVYAPLLGMLWLILGLGIVGFTLLTCLCCRDKWDEMRDPAYAKYTKKDLYIPLVFMLVGIVAVLVGFSVMVAGGVQLRNSVNHVTSFITETVDFTASVVYNLSHIVETSASITIANTVIPPDRKAELLAKARETNQTAAELQAKTADGITIINDGLRVLTITFYVIGCVITFLCIFALLFSLLKWVVASNVIVTLIWIVVFFTWCTTAGLIIAYLVNGDTSVALEQVQTSPTIMSAMDKYLHCIPSAKIENATRYARHTTATVLTTANTSVTNNVPGAFKLVGAPGGICVPYGPAPNYTRDDSLCGDSTISFTQFINKLSTTANSSAIVPDVVKNDLTATVTTLAMLQTTIPNVLVLANCSYIAEIAKFIIDEAKSMLTDFQMLWIGFLVITIACMMQALSMPIYVFRAVRLGDRLGDAEAEGLYKASAVPVAYPAGNEPSTVEGSDNTYGGSEQPYYNEGGSYAGESGAGYK